MKQKLFVPAFLWFCISLVLLCLPGSTFPKYPWLAAIHADKWIHIGMFGILCYLFSYPFLVGGKDVQAIQRKIFIITIAGIVYGTVMEFVQKYWIPNRSFEIWDIAADSTGCLVAFFYCRRYLKKIGPDRNRDRNQN